MENDAILELRNAEASRGDEIFLDGVSLTLEDAAATFIMGHAGSGKSTLLKVAAGIRVPEAGMVLFRGRDLSRMSRREMTEFRRLTGFVFQDAALWANQSIYDNLALPLHVHEPAWSSADIDRAVRSTAELVGFDGDLRQRPVDLSSGERKLIGIARAIILDPVLLFMDDPAANLDEAAIDRVYGIVAALRERGRTMAVVTASSDFASRFADRICVINRGKLAAQGTYDEAIEWTEPAVKSVIGRLRTRKANEAPDWASGLLGAWADALAGDNDTAETLIATERRRSPSIDGTILGDIINASAEEPEEREDDEALQPERKDGE